jgi:hypothetical protein
MCCMSLGMPLGERRLLGLVLVLALVRGLVYLAVFPPWQHYDEPTHFEYVDLIARRGSLPRPGDYDLAMRHEIAASMVAADFWKGTQPPPIEPWSASPPAIGISELEHPAFYYALQALPQRLVPHHGVETRLYLARLGSVLLFLVVVVAAYGLGAELCPQRRFLPAAVASLVAFLPPLTDLMSSVNNDVGAITLSSLLLWASVCLIRRGPSLGRVAIVLVLAGLCFLTKSSSAIVAMITLLGLAAACLPKVYRRWLGRGLVLLAPVIVLLALRWDRHAALWYGFDPPTAANRVVADTPLGQAAFVLSTAMEHPRGLYQELMLAQGRALRGHTVTFGFQSRAKDGNGGTLRAGLYDGRKEVAYPVTLTGDWQTHLFTATVGHDTPGVAVHILLPASAEFEGEAYVDGVFLVDAVGLGDLPQFDDVEFTTASWGARTYENLVRNGSAEATWPALRPWIGNPMLNNRYSAATMFHAMLDSPRTGWVYGWEARVLFQSFWGRFGWNHLALPAAWFWAPGLVSAAALLGCGLGLLRRAGVKSWAAWQRGAGALLAMVWLVVWLIVVLRIQPVFVTSGVDWPVARYGAVVIIPTALGLCLGLVSIVPGPALRPMAWLGLLGLIALDAVAMLTVILPYYYG